MILIENYFVIGIFKKNFVLYILNRFIWNMYMIDNLRILEFCVIIDFFYN